MATAKSWLLIVPAVLLAGCSAVNVQRAKDVSSAGIAYTQATAALINAAIDAEIDADSEATRRTYTKPLELPAEDVAKRLAASDEGLIGAVKELHRFKAHVSTLEAYFRALQALADGSQAEAAQAAVASLAERMNALNKVVNAGSNNGRPLIRDDQKAALGGLAKMVAKEIHGALLGHTLKRDAPIIGEALLLQEKIVADAETSILGQLREANARFYVDRVLAPYRKPPLAPAWAADRRTYIKAAALGLAAKEVTSTQATARQMQEVWKKILAGEYSAGEVTAVLQETQDLLEAIAAVKKAEQPPSANL